MEEKEEEEEEKKGLLNETGRRRATSMLASHLSISRSLSRFSQIRSRAGGRRTQTFTFIFVAVVVANISGSDEFGLKSRVT